MATSSLPFLLLLLLLLLHLTSNSHALDEDGIAALRKKKKKPSPTPTYAPTMPSVSFLLNGNRYSCPLASETSRALIRTCENGSPATLTTAVLPSTSAPTLAPTVEASYTVGCTQACLSLGMAASSVQANVTCVGFNIMDKSTCQLVTCPRGVAAGIPDRLPRKKKPSKPKKHRPFVPTAVAIATSMCYTKLPAPTMAPIPKCNDTRLGTQGAYNPSAFIPVQVDQPLCEVAQARGPKPVTFQRLNTFKCDITSCLRWCQWDSGCNFIMYSPVAQQCLKASGLQTTDDPANFQSYWAQQWVAFRKAPSFGGPNYVPYYSGLCNNLVQRDCNNHPECHWKKGKQGYNAESLGGGWSGGWCGRVKCTAYKSTKAPHKKKKRHG